MNNVQDNFFQSLSLNPNFNKISPVQQLILKHGLQVLKNSKAAKYLVMFDHFDENEFLS